MGWGGSTSSGSFCNEGAVKAGIASRHHFPTLLPRLASGYFTCTTTDPGPDQRKFCNHVNVEIWFNLTVSTFTFSTDSKWLCWSSSKFWNVKWFAQKPSVGEGRRESYCTARQPPLSPLAAKYPDQLSVETKTTYSVHPYLMEMMMMILTWQW